ncbi:MAG: tRNA (adenosine(37)-N6)-threonylcarbamoyltransferase complex ATPase subunit type 1 TsaE [Bacteroidota bacterium]
MHHQSRNSLETQKIAFDLVQKMGGKGIIFLHGHLGAGKTTFAKGCGKALEIEERSVKSPSFTYIREYTGKNGKKMIHCDFYRLDGKHKFAEQTWKELQEEMGGNTLFVVEWAEKLRGKNSGEEIHVEIEMKNAKSPEGEIERTITISFPENFQK